MYCSIPRMLKGIRLAEEANSRRGIPVTAPDSKIRITVAVSLVKFSEALPRSRTKATAGIRRTEVSTLNPWSGLAGATFLINP
tara:strand:+ start:828 stop:1076 length:249 start_codon:yes stop_codon:yes gene_type:complete